MADFSELCPLFNTGVFNEITFPAIRLLTSVTITANLLGGTGDPATIPSDFKFSRTVIVTEAFMRRYVVGSTDMNFHLGKRVGSGTAAATAKGTYTSTISLSIYDLNNWKAFATVTAFTLNSADVLNLSMGTLTATVIGDYHLIVRYKEA
jgi:hypothetical protein